MNLKLDESFYQQFLPVWKIMESFMQFLAQKGRTKIVPFGLVIPSRLKKLRTKTS